MNYPSKFNLLFAGLLLISLTLSACAKSQAAGVVQSEVGRQTEPAASSTDLQTLAAGNRALAFDLYQALRDRPGNLFYSPYSISVALAMTYAGARGETAQQMADTLHYPLPQQRLHPAFNALDLQFSSESQDAFQLHVANSLWGREGVDFEQPFLDTLAQNYGAGLRLLDFVGATETSRQIINDWVSQQTQERIENLIPKGGITPDTVLVLVNAIYFKAQWTHAFGEHLTHDQPFNTLDSGQVDVPMMGLAEPAGLAYARGEGYQAVELPYQGEQTSMVILVPDAGQFDRFEAGLNAQGIEAILAQMEIQQVALRLPKFSYESELNLANTLADMGMPAAFGDADFSGMTGDRSLFISEVFHKAFVAVDEAGTEAAAATAVVMKESLPAFDVELTVDRPFVFFIRDTETGAILFVGRVLDPTG